MRKRVGPFAAFAALISTAVASAQLPADAVAPETPFREPFVLRLRVDNKRYYEQHFARTPYVMGKAVCLFAGEAFGIDVKIVGSEIARIAYRPEAASGDVDFRFSQEKTPSGPMTMLLSTRNRLKRTLFFDALMTVPEKEGIFETHVLPVAPMLTNFESWPHPIVQLVLRNFRFSEERRDGRNVTQGE